MKKFAFNQTVSALALGVASLGSQAAGVTINFESLGPAVLANIPVTNPPSTVAVPLAFTSVTGTPLSSGDPSVNVNFTGAWAWHYDMMLSTDPKPDRGLTTPTNTGAFILNSKRGSLDEPGHIDLFWGGPDFLNRYLKSITFDIYATGDTPFLTGFDGSTLVSTKEFTSGNSDNLWTRKQGVTFDNGSQVSALRFGTLLGAGKIGLDNLQFEFFDATGGGGGTGGTVPEPASFGLVALALLGAGVATRRRKSA